MDKRGKREEQKEQKICQNWLTSLIQRQIEKVGRLIDEIRSITVILFFTKFLLVEDMQNMSVGIGKHPFAKQRLFLKGVEK